MAKNCKTIFYLVKFYKEHNEQRNTHATHVKYMETPYDKTMTNLFGNIESHTTFVDTKLNTLDIFLLLDSATMDTILCDKIFFVTRWYYDKIYHHHH